MESIMDFIKNFFVLMLILIIFSYLVPKESYQKYLQFFIGIFMAIVLLQPVTSWIMQGNQDYLYKNLQEITKRLNDIEFNEENKEDIFGLFYLDE